MNLHMDMERMYALHALAIQPRRAAEEARSWLLDVFSEPEDVEDIQRINQIQLVQSVETHYEGGYRQFLADSFNLKGA
jgi:hypothetical protein